MAEDGDFDGLAAGFLELSEADRMQVMAKESVAKYMDETRAIYLYLVDACDKGKHDITIPAMLVPAAIGQEYETRHNQTHFVTRHLKKLGTEGVDWEFRDKTKLFANGTTSGFTEFPVPGQAEKKIVLRPDPRNRAKYPFVTPDFARKLILQSQTPVGREICAFYSVVHDETIDFIRGRASKLDGVREQRTQDPAGRSFKRLKVCETQKDLMLAISTNHPNSHRGVYSAVNDTTNKIVTGRTKRETAEQLGMDPKRVNARDYYTEGQLVAAMYGEFVSASFIEEQAGRIDDVQAFHGDVMRDIVRGKERLLVGKIASTPHSLMDARKQSAEKKRALPPATAGAKQIGDYFTPKKRALISA